MLSVILTILGFLVILSTLVLIHELGHFLAARFFKMRVEEFGLGFPPKLCTITKKGDTEYTLNWLPLGGFVRLKGEQGNEEGVMDPDSFAAKPIWQRIIVLAAGVFMNFVLTVAVLTIGFMVGLPAFMDGMSTGGTVRDAAIIITHVAPGSPAQKSDLQTGDKIISFDGEVMSEVGQVREYTRTRLGQTVAVKIKRGSEELTKDTHVEVLAQTKEPGIGIGFLQSGIVSYPPHIAFIEACKGTWYLTVGIVQSLWNAITHFTVDGFSGPVGIAVATGETAKLGYAYMLFLIAQLSLGLAVMNILPIPALDGGRILFAVIEKLRGRVVAAATEGVIHTIGFFALIGLIILITVKDIMRLIP